MKINLQKYARIREWWQHILPPIFLFFYTGLQKTADTEHHILLLYVFIIGLSVMTAFTGYFLNDLFDIKEDLAIGKFNFVARMKQRTKHLLPLLLLSVLLVFYFISIQWFSSYERHVFRFFFAVNILLFLIYSAPPLRLKSNPFISVILDALYSGTLFYLMAFLSVLKEYREYDTVVACIFLFGLAKGIRNYLSHIAVNAETDKKAGHITAAVTHGRRNIQLLSNMVYPVELLLIAFILYYTTGFFLLVYPLLILFAIKWIYMFMHKKQEYLPGLNDIYEIWLPVLLLLLTVYSLHKFYLLLVIHTILFPNFLDKIYFYTIFKIVGPLRK